jgi:hypothetical protein
MKMVHRLATIGSGIDDRAEAIREPFAPGNSGGNQVKVSNQILICGF